MVGVFLWNFAQHACLRLGVMGLAVNERRARPMSWIIYYFLLPILASALFAGIALQILGVNVLGKIATVTTQTAAIRHMLGEPPSAPSAPSQVVALTRQLRQKSGEITRLKQSVTALEAKAAADQAHLLTLSRQAKADQTQIHKAGSAAQNAAKQAKVYMDMSPNQAAVILTQLSFADQVLVLRAMNSADEASILAVMPPKQAAKLLQAGA